MTPKVFISYSWTTQAHQERVKEWADRLIDDGVNVVIDIYDLKEGQDKYAFMESMVTDPEITHVLAVSDRAYSHKANKREKGVGTESQIISKEVYKKVAQSKFIPIVCEFSDPDTPCLPVFLESRIWIDFSTPEAVNGHWERLVRLLHGKPLHVKPQLGSPPAYLSEEDSVPSLPARAKFSTLRQAILQGKPGIRMYRTEFLDACTDFVDAMRVRKAPDTENFAQKVVDDCSKLLVVRDLLVDWVLLESDSAPSEDFSEALIDTLERVLQLKSRPEEVTTWNDGWFDAHKLFAYETFLYLIAALLRARAFDDLHEVFTSHYLRSATESQGNKRYDAFEHFNASSGIISGILAPEGTTLLSPTAALIKRHATRKDLPFDEIIQADLLAMMMALISPGLRWFPQTFYYMRYNMALPLFLRATQHKNFRKLAVITGISDANDLRSAIAVGNQRLNTANSGRMSYDITFSEAMNLDNLDTIK